MSESSKAIFLSYAREDAAAARRIAEALRASGLEVWFDENELRGGEAWDAKIRKQIDACALFIPLISAHTQERSKGYFRLEWKLAVDQTHLLAAGVPFVAPVVIDATTESGALVPPEFMRVQWTRLPGALPTPDFVTQVKRLLEGGVGPVSDRPSGRTQAEAGQRPAQPKKLSPLALWISLGVVFAAVGVVFVVTGKKNKDASPPTATTPDPKSQTPTPAPAPAPRIADKSIAVLPFANMSEDKETSAFFADGIHEDILTNLALIRELRVVSRTTVQGYRGTAKPMKQIAQELGVTYILEGSVRRVGNKVRITGQLIHAATDEHVWAQTYDRDLTDIFAIQSELSQQIAGTLKTVLSPEEKILIARRLTDNPEAYDLSLQARDVINREGFVEAAQRKQIRLLERAVELDPNFAQAWAELAAARAFWHFNGLPDSGVQLARAKEAIERAMQLAPDDPEVFGNLGTYYYYGFRDYVRATEQYERRARIQPNSPTVFHSLALIQRRQGRWTQSLANSRRACELDPANVGFHRALATTLSCGHRWEEARAVRRRMVALSPNSLPAKFELAMVSFHATGSRREMEDFFAGLSPAEFDSPQVLSLRQEFARYCGDFAEAARIDQIQPYYEGGLSSWIQTVTAALDYLELKDEAAARKRLGNVANELRELVRREPDNMNAWNSLALYEGAFGDPAEARRCADRIVAIMPEARDALSGPNAALLRAQGYEMAGDKEVALAEYARLLLVPGSIANVHELKYNSAGPLRGDPRLEALINDPKNNAPLF